MSKTFKLKAPVSMKDEIEKLRLDISIHDQERINSLALLLGLGQEISVDDQLDIIKKLVSGELVPEYVENETMTTDEAVCEIASNGNPVSAIDKAATSLGQEPAFSTFVDPIIGMTLGAVSMFRSDPFLAKILGKEFKEDRKHKRYMDRAEQKIKELDAASKRKREEEEAAQSLYYKKRREDIRIQMLLKENQTNKEQALNQNVVQFVLDRRPVTCTEEPPQESEVQETMIAIFREKRNEFREFYERAGRVCLYANVPAKLKERALDAFAAAVWNSSVANEGEVQRELPVASWTPPVVTTRNTQETEASPTVVVQTLYDLVCSQILNTQNMNKNFTAVLLRSMVNRPLDDAAVYELCIKVHRWQQEQPSQYQKRFYAMYVKADRPTPYVLTRLMDNDPIYGALIQWLQGMATEAPSYPLRLSQTTISNELRPLDRVLIGLEVCYFLLGFSLVLLSTGSRSSVQVMQN